MITNIRYFSYALLALTLSINTYAFNPKKSAHTFGEPIRATLIINEPKNPSNFSVSNPSQSKTIRLMNLRMSATQKRNFFKHAPITLNQNHAPTAKTSSLPSDVALDMSKVPVLDQGDYGTCVTFATAATLDALLGQGELMSPLCTLQVGSYFENRGYGPSGWEGSFAAIALSRAEDFGIITMSAQREASCGTLNEYPSRGMPNGREMTLDDFHAQSMDISEDIHWHSLLTLSERLANPAAFPQMIDRVFAETKRALASNTASNPVAVMVGVFLPYTYCRMGACGQYHTQFDSWVLTNKMVSDFTNSPESIEIGGHEMVITGYDDNAIIKDNEGISHRGVFTLRNSWSSKAGDNGNFYMSYEFFQTFVNEATVVRFSKDD